MPSLKRPLAIKVLSAFFLALAIYCIGKEFTKAAGILNSQVDFFIYVSALIAALAWILASYGLWMGRPWGWWLAGLSCTTSALMTALQLVTFFVARSNLPSTSGMQGPLLWTFIALGIFWIAFYSAPLFVLLRPDVLALFSKGHAKWVPRLLALIGTGMVSLVAIVGLAFAVIASSWHDMEKSQPWESPDAFASGTGSIRDMKVSPDGRFLACIAYPPGKGDYYLALLEIKSGKIKWVHVPLNRDHFLWSPDSRRIVLYEVGMDEATLLDVSSGKAARTFKVLTSHMAFHPDGSVWFLDSEGSLRRYDFDTGQSTQVTEARLPIQDFALDAQGKILAVAWGEAPNQVIRLLDPSTGGFIREWPGMRYPPIRAMRYSPDGQKLFTLHWQGNGHKDFWIQLWNARTGEVDSVVDNVPPIGHSFDGIDFSPDGKFLSTQSQGNPHRIWSIGQKGWTWYQPGSYPSGPFNAGVFSPDSREFWTGAGLPYPPFSPERGSVVRWRFTKLLHPKESNYAAQVPNPTPSTMGHGTRRQVLGDGNPPWSSRTWFKAPDLERVMSKPSG